MWSRGAAVLCLFLWGGHAAINNKQQQPNLVFLLVDDLGWADVSYRGGDGNKTQTPVLEELLAGGIQLNRHYAYSWCAPSRASLMSGRLPVHVNVNATDPMSVNPADKVSGSAGIPTKMTLVSGKLKQAGYSTHYNGKWGVGFARPEQMPLSRGYDSFLGYLMDSNDYWDSTVKSSSVEVPKACEKHGINGIRDLSLNDGPAYGLNGTMWEDYLFMNQSLKLIAEHDPAKGVPLFLFHAFHSIHTPLDPPAELLEPYSRIADPTRRAYNAMVSFMDSSVGKLVEQLKLKGMWQNTLLVISSDNGGPIYAGKSLKLFGGADNHPLRGGKTSDWEGGIRVNAMVSGVDPADQLAAQHNLPPIDSINQWPLLSGAVAKGARTGMHISPKTLIAGNWKLLTGSDAGNINKFQSPDKVKFDIYGVGYGISAVRNVLNKGRDCGKGCLYDIRADPTESSDVAQQNPEVVQTLMARLHKLNQGVFNPDRGEFVGIDMCYKLLERGYYGPIDPIVQNQ